VCGILGTLAVTTTAINVSIAGLTVITLERYVKIVHLVASRNHYRPWTTRLGIVLVAEALLVLFSDVRRTLPELARSI